MNFELTISGLSVIALRSSEGRPVSPEAVDVICPAAHMHRPRLSYLPGQVRAAVEPEMAIDHVGGRIASLDLRGMFLEFTFTKNPHTAFTLHCGPEDAMTPPDEGFMNWVPSLHDLGFDDFRMGPAGSLPAGAGARITLPPGELVCRNVVRDPNTGEFLVWEFPHVGAKRALANEVVFRARGVETLRVNDRDGQTILTATEDEHSTLRMSVSNDLDKVPHDYPEGVTSLEHLMHLDVLAPLRGGFDAPHVVADQRTAKPICNQAIFVYEEI